MKYKTYIFYILLAFGLSANAQTKKNETIPKTEQQQENFTKLIDEKIKGVEYKVESTSTRIDEKIKEIENRVNYREKQIDDRSNYLDRWLMVPVL